MKYCFEENVDTGKKINFLLSINWESINLLNSKDNKKTAQLYVYDTTSNDKKITSGFGIFDSYNYFYDYKYEHHLMRQLYRSILHIAHYHELLYQ